jgi:hypothetical protein
LLYENFLFANCLPSGMLDDNELGEITSTYLGKWDNRQKYA